MGLTSKFIQKEIDDGNTLVLDNKFNTRKIVIFSDWHLGTGGNNDNSLKNCLYIFEALKYYNENNYLVILLGDTFELAEKNSIEDIKNIHEDIMWILTEIYMKNNLVIVRGNHDAYIKEKDVKDRMFSYTKKRIDMFPNIRFYDSVKFNTGKKTYFIMHGHQYSKKYMKFNRIICWILRYIYSPLEMYILKDPTGEMSAFGDTSGPTKLFSEMAVKNNMDIICGHMHTVSMNYPRYYNVGSGVLPRCITCGEIINGDFFMYKWSTVVEEGIMTIKKTLLG